MTSQATDMRERSLWNYKKHRFLSHARHPQAARVAGGGGSAGGCRWRWVVARARAIWIISVGVTLSTHPRRQLELDIHQLALLQGGAQGLTEKGHSLSDRLLELVLGTASRFRPEC